MKTHILPTLTMFGTNCDRVIDLPGRKERQGRGGAACEPRKRQEHDPGAGITAGVMSSQVEMQQVQWLFVPLLERNFKKAA